METKMLNFRCPSELLDSIDEWGKENYPSDNKNGCDRSKTLIHIIEAGLMALNDGSVEVERKTQGKTDSKTELNTEELKAALRNSPKNSQVIQDAINEAIAPIQQQLQELSQRLGKWRRVEVKKR